MGKKLILVMKSKIILFTITALFLAIGGVGCEKKEYTYYDIIATGTLIFDPTYTIDCSPRTHILKRDRDELQLIILSDDGEVDRTYDNPVVIVFGNKIKEISYSSCSYVVVYDVKEIYRIS